MAVLAAAFLPAACAQYSSTGSSRLEILPDEWHLAGFENALDLSGLAAASRTHVLVGSDEMFHVQPGVIDREKRRIESRRPIALPLVDQGGKQEIDIEGVAFSPDERAYFVVGSHGLGKKKGDLQVDRLSVFRLPVNTSTGEIDRSRITRGSLLPWLEKTPRLAPHVKRPLQQDGLNIEGLTWSGGKLFFGLRSPNRNGEGLVIELAPHDLFHGKPRELKVHGVAMEKGRGIREITAVRDGFILLTGNAAAEASKKFPTSTAPGPDTRFDLLFWNGRDRAAERVGTLPENGGKGEALLVLEDADSHVDLLVVFDGLLGGEPMAVRVQR